jgi:hypothetical protein
MKNHNWNNYKQANIKLINDQKLARGKCADCQMLVQPSNVVCFAWDHIDPSTKFRDVSRMKNYSVESILAEINKCELVCHNCHTLRTYYGRKYINTLHNIPDSQLSLF